MCRVSPAPRFPDQLASAWLLYICSGDTSGKSSEDPVQSSASSKETVTDEATPAVAAESSKDEEQERQQPSAGEKSVDTVADISLPKTPVVSKPGSGSGWEKVSDADSSEKSSEGNDEPGSER